jgi:hypothetical protein
MAEIQIGNSRDRSARLGYSAGGEQWRTLSGEYTTATITLRYVRKLVLQLLDTSNHSLPALGYDNLDQYYGPSPTFQKMSHSVLASLQILRGSPHDPLPYWQVNVPASERSGTCPDFLLNQSEKNQQTLSTPDEEFRRLTWPEVKELIG